MDNQQFLPIILALFPIVAGIVSKIAKLSISNIRLIGLAAIVVLGAFLFSTVETDPPI